MATLGTTGLGIWYAAARSGGAKAKQNGSGPQFNASSKEEEAFIQYEHAMRGGPALGRS